MIGTFLVILAHMGVPSSLQNIRTFDVVMLVFISGMSYALSYNNSELLKYIKKRIFKLLVPTYCVLIALFGLAYVACFITGRSQLLSLNTMLHSILFLNDGIGYIWIVRVYLIIAVFSFFSIKAIDAKIGFSKFFMPLVTIIMVVFIQFSTFLYGKNIFVDSYIIEVLPYCLIAFFGMLAIKKAKSLDLIMSCSTVIFIVMQVMQILEHNGFNPDGYKYPPKLYYLSYGVMITCILLKIIPNRRNSIIEWYSTNSFMIYLFHIIFLFALNLLSDIPVLTILNIWWIKYILVMLCSTCLFFILNKIKKEFLK